MAERGTTGGVPGPEGLAGGPGPTPPGFDDGTPHPLEGPAADAAAADAAARGAREQAAERAPAARGDPEEPDPS